MNKNAEIYVTLKGLVPTPREQAFIELKEFEKTGRRELTQSGSREDWKEFDKKRASIMRRIGDIPYTVELLGGVPSQVRPDSARASLIVAMLKHPGLTYGKYLRMTGHSGRQSEFRTCLKFFGYTEVVNGKIALTEAGKALARVLEDRGAKIYD